MFGVLRISNVCLRAGPFLGMVLRMVLADIVWFLSGCVLVLSFRSARTFFVKSCASWGAPTAIAVAELR